MRFLSSLLFLLSNFRSSGLPLQSFRSHHRKPPCSANSLGMANTYDPNRTMAVKSASGSMSSAEMNNANIEEEKSETYSNNMTEARGAVLTYRDESGMNYNFIRPDLIVGSCLQTPEDVDKLRRIGVKTIFCLQQDRDLECCGVDINAIREYARSCNDIQHLRAEIREFDTSDLRMKLPTVVGKLYKAINRNGGVTYVHCTAGLGRAPAVALAYMFWVQGYKLYEANRLTSKRSCFPKLDVIKNATADIRMPLHFDDEQGLWVLKKELPEGRYEYKYIVDGEWTCNKYELVTSPNKDGHVNNFLQVLDDTGSVNGSLRKRLTRDDPDLIKDERLRIREFLEACPDEEH